MIFSCYLRILSNFKLFYYFFVTREKIIFILVQNITILLKYFIKLSL